MEGWLLTSGSLIKVPATTGSWITSQSGRCGDDRIGDYWYVLRCVMLQPPQCTRTRAARVVRTTLGGSLPLLSSADMASTRPRAPDWPRRTLVASRRDCVHLLVFCPAVSCPGQSMSTESELLTLDRTRHCSDQAEQAHRRMQNFGLSIWTPSCFAAECSRCRPRYVVPTCELQRWHVFGIDCT